MREYIKKLVFVFKEIFKAGPGVFFLSIASMVISGINPVITTFLTAKLIQELNNSIGNTNGTLRLILILLVMLSMIVISFSIDNVKTIICSIVGLKLSNEIENSVAIKFQSIKRERIDDPAFIDLHTNTLNKCGTEPLNLMEGLFNMISTAIGLLGYSIVLFKLNILSLIGIVIFTIPIIVMKKKYQGVMFKYYDSSTMSLRRVWYYLSLMTDPEYMNEVRHYRLFNTFFESRKNIFSDFINGSYKIARKEIVVSLISSIVSMIGAILVGIWITKKTISGSITVSDFYLYITAVITIVTDMIALSNQLASNDKSLMFINYLFEYTGENDLIEYGNKKISGSSEHSIKFVNVSFAYPGRNEYALKDINLEFKTNETICLVGENGGGKTTLVKLLLRIYDPIEGDIYLDDVNIKEYNIDDLRKFYGVLFQDYIKYSDNVRNCIGYGNVEEKNDIERIRKAAMTIGADSFINQYPHGYETNLSKMFYEDAIEPSGGQWQKISIARAINSDASVLVLDEPTAALDPESEVKMYDLFKKISETKSTIIISHRMYITRIADRIVLLKNGRVMEEGTFNKLIKNRGDFYNMYKMQSDNYSIE